jgi:hypothetical protein
MAVIVGFALPSIIGLVAWAIGLAVQTYDLWTNPAPTLRPAQLVKPGETVAAPLACWTQPRVTDDPEVICGDARTAPADAYGFMTYPNPVSTGSPTANPPTPSPTPAG